MQLLSLFIIIRLLVPLIIFRFSLVGIALSVLVDVYDWVFLHPNASQYHTYQVYDKIMDLYMFSIVFLTSLSWNDKVARKISIVTYTFRLVGDAIFLLFGLQWIFLITPNIFETLTFMYLGFRALSKKTKMYTSTARIYWVLFIVTVPKMIHEYLIHILKLQPWDLFSLGAFAHTTGIVQTYIDYIGWGLIIHAFQITTTVAYIVHARRK